MAHEFQQQRQGEPFVAYRLLQRAEKLPAVIAEDRPVIDVQPPIAVHIPQGILAMFIQPRILVKPADTQWVAHYVAVSIGRRLDIRVAEQRIFGNTEVDGTSPLPCTFQTALKRQLELPALVFYRGGEVSLYGSKTRYGRQGIPHQLVG